MSATLNKSARCFVAYLWGNPVAFNAVIPYPSGTVQNAFRGHRLVVIPDYQGMGIGNNLSEATAEMYLREGKRYFAKTANAKLGRYRNKSLKWRPTSKNNMRRADVVMRDDIHNYNNLHNKDLAMRLCFSHEYVGEE